MQASVIKINGIAPSCQKALEGSGFVVGPDLVMTNAHVVAGTSEVTVDSPDGPLDADVVLFDPEEDVAVLRVSQLQAPVLPFAPNPAESGSDAIVLGYPGGGPYTASPARIREIINLSGPDIYRTGTVQREVYTVRGSVRQGNSGGPLVNSNGEVLGVVFGAAVDDPDTGFVLTATEISDGGTSAFERDAQDFLVHDVWGFLVHVVPDVPHCSTRQPRCPVPIAIEGGG